MASPASLHKLSGRDVVVVATAVVVASVVVVYLLRS